MSDTFRQRGSNLPRPPSGNHVLETGSGDQDFLSEQHFSKEQFSVDPLPPPSDMNTMNLFHLASAANPNSAQAASRRPVSPSRSVATTPKAAKPLTKNAAGGGGDFFGNFKESDSLRPSLVDKTPDAFNDFIEDFHFDREFAFSRLGQAPEEDEIAEDGAKDPEAKATFGGFSLPTGIHKFADMSPPDWIKDSGW